MASIGDAVYRIVDQLGVVEVVTTSDREGIVMTERDRVRQAVRQALDEVVQPLGPEALAEFAEAYLGFDDEAGLGEDFRGLFVDALLHYFGFPVTNGPDDLELVSKLSDVGKISVGNYETIEAQAREAGVEPSEVRAAAVLPFLMEAGALSAFTRRWERWAKPAITDSASSKPSA